MSQSYNSIQIGQNLSNNSTNPIYILISLNFKRISKRHQRYIIYKLQSLLCPFDPSERTTRNPNQFHVIYLRR